MAADQDEGNDDAQGLCRDSGDGGAGGAQACIPHQKEIAGDVEDAGDGNRDKRRPGIADAAEDAAKQVVGDDDKDSATADPDIGNRAVKSFFGRVHQSADLRRQKNQYGGQRKAQTDEEGDASADGLSAALAVAAADLLAEKYRDAHGKAADRTGQRDHDIGARRNCGYVRG